MYQDNWHRSPQFCFSSIARHRSEEIHWGHLGVKQGKGTFVPLVDRIQWLPFWSYCSAREASDWAVNNKIQSSNWKKRRKLLRGYVNGEVKLVLWGNVVDGMKKGIQNCPDECMQHYKLDIWMAAVGGMKKVNDTIFLSKLLHCVCRNLLYAWCIMLFTMVVTYLKNISQLIALVLVNQAAILTPS